MDIIKSYTFNNTPNFISPNPDSYKEELPLEEYFKSLFQLENKDKYIKKYKQEIKEKLNKFCAYSAEYLIFLIKVLHKKSFEKNTILIDYNVNNIVFNFLPYLYLFLRIENKKILIERIKFRIKFIKEILVDQLNLLMTKNIITEKIFSEIKSKSIEGIYIEKEIIYYLITKNIDYDKVKINRIYCFDSELEKIKLGKKLIFIQRLESAPIYDFGVIEYINGEPTFKGYQIGINKPIKSLMNLIKEKIIMDISYFISRINKYLDKIITKFSFGIITTTYAFNSQKNKDKSNGFNDNGNDAEIETYSLNDDENKEENDNEYKNYNIMKKYCNENNFEFLLFNPETCEFNIDNDKGSLEKINFNTYHDKKVENNVTKVIFKNEEKYDLIKLPLNPNEITKKDIENIQKLVISIKDNQLNFIAKFKKNSSKNIDVNALSNLINNNFLIYMKDINLNITIYFKNKYICDKCIDSDIFYVFDTTVIKSKKGRKKTNILLIDEKSFKLNIKSNKNDDEKNKGNLFLNRIRKRSSSVPNTRKRCRNGHKKKSKTKKQNSRKIIRK
jgi:hypothetical protein